MFLLNQPLLLLAKAFFLFRLHSIIFAFEKTFMNWVDILLIVIMLVAVWDGWQRGFLLGSLALLGWIGSVYVGFLFYPYGARLLEQYVPSLGVWNLPLAFILVVVLTRLILSVIINGILSTTPPSVHRSALNHAAGIIPGIINGFIYS